MTTYFDRDFEALEEKFRNQAEEDGDVFLPSIKPHGKVDFVLIGAEPSLGSWAKDKREAREKISQGFRDFSFSLGDFILHYCARAYLCQGERSYHVTDLSKGAMLVKKAGENHTERYSRWHDLLMAEWELVSKESTRVISIGGSAAKFLKGKAPLVSKTILHHSNQAAKYRARCVKGRESQFREFAAQCTLGDVLEVAKSIIYGIPMDNSLAAGTLDRLQSHRGLSESQKKLAFGYMLDFSEM